jgi:hypothetical protein
LYALLEAGFAGDVVCPWAKSQEKASKKKASNIVQDGMWIHLSAGQRKDSLTYGMSAYNPLEPQIASKADSSLRSE